MTTFTQVTIMRQSLNEQRVKWKDQFQRNEKMYEAKMAELAEMERLLIGGFDAGRIDRARNIMRIYGQVTEVVRGNSWREHTERMDALEDSKKDLASGYEYLKTGYFGVKNYSGFGDQRADCEYNMGPPHGSVVFSIGFTHEMRDKVRQGYKLTPQEIEDALYLLSVLPQIEKEPPIAAA